MASSDEHIQAIKDRSATLAEIIPVVEYFIEVLKELIALDEPDRQVHPGTGGRVTEISRAGEVAAGDHCALPAYRRSA